MTLLDKLLMILSALAAVWFIGWVVRALWVAADVYFWHMGAPK